MTTSITSSAEPQQLDILNTSVSPNAYSPHFNGETREAKHDKQEHSASRFNGTVIPESELANRWRVSKKTLSRYEKIYGLTSVRFSNGQGRALKGYSQEVIEVFEKTHAKRIKRGRAFSRVGDPERNQIINTAIRLISEAGTCFLPAGGIGEIARDFRRSSDTIRKVLKKHDRQNSNQPLLPCNEINHEQLVKIGSDLYKTLPKKEIINKHTLSTKVFNAISAAALFEFLKQQIKIFTNGANAKMGNCYVNSQEFTRRDAAKIILYSEMPTNSSKISGAPKGTEAYQASLYQFPLLTKEQEQYLFRKYNYLKFRSSQLLEAIHDPKPGLNKINQAAAYWRQAEVLRNTLITRNLRLVIKPAGKAAKADLSFDDAISLGNEAVTRAVEGFDYGIGNKFSTYASWAIINTYRREYHRRCKAAARGSAEVEIELIAQGKAAEGSYLADIVNYNENVKDVERLLAYLDDREKQVIRLRYGLGGPEIEKHTLKEVGLKSGVTKERIRQIEVRAMKKLQKVIRQYSLKLPFDALGRVEVNQAPNLEKDICNNRKLAIAVIDSLKTGGRQTLGELKLLVAPKQEKKLLETVKELVELGKVERLGGSIYRATEQ